MKSRTIDIEQHVESEETLALIERIKKGFESECLPKEDCSELLKTYEITVEFCANEIEQAYSQFSPRHKDLVHEGNVAVLEATKGYDQSFGTKFSTYVQSVIRTAMIKSINFTRKKFSRTSFIEPLARRVRKIEEAFQAKGQEITDNEILEILNRKRKTQLFTLDDVRRAKEIENIEITSLSETEQAEQEGAIIDSPQMVHLIRYDQQRLIHEVFLPLSSVRDREILKQFWGLDNQGELNSDEVGANFNLSGSRIIQIKDKAIQAIRKLSTDQNIPLDDYGL